MKLDILFDDFELLADAPNSVQKLREMILQLAVQGKLVPQDSKDEPARVLLEKIKAENERLIKEKKIKKPKPLPPINSHETPYKVPNSWEWVRLRTVCYDLGQKKPDKKFTYIDVTSIDKEKGVISDELKLLEAQEAPSRARKIVEKGTVIYSTVRPYLLNIAIIDHHFDPEPIVSTAFVVLNPFRGIYNRYIYYYLRSKPFIEYVEDAMTGVAYPAINDGKMNIGLIPIPPTKEQKRIVTKIDGLMALCDELEASKQQVSINCIHLNDASIHKFLTTHELQNFSKHWQRIYDNFDLLYSKLENVNKLRQAILQLAVQGKLVPQNPKDEPASVLLERIKAEKERLVKDKEIQKTKPLPDFDLGDVPFELPKGWIWTRWDNISLKIGDVDHKMPIEQKSGIPYISPRDFGPDNFIDFNNAKKISEADFRKLSKKIKPEKQDVIFPRYGTIGENRYVEDDIDFLASYSCAVIKVLKGFMSPKFIFYYSLSPLVKAEINKYINKTTQANVGVKSIKNFIFPLPPLKEQKLIETKVDQLMGLCDELEIRLLKSQTDCGRLMEATVAEILAA